jgi:hypothetical protein
MVGRTTREWANYCDFDVVCPHRKEHAQIVRVLITVSPRMYREALAFAVQRNRPHFDMKSASPDDIHQEVKSFGPDVLVRNDGLAPEVLAEVPFWVELRYTDSMNARIALGGWIEEFDDASKELLLTVVEEAAEELVSEDE